MDMQAALAALLEQAAELGARKALEQAGHTGRRLVPVKSEEGLLSYRQRLNANKRGLALYRDGGSTFVDLLEEQEFVARQPVRLTDSVESEEADRVQALIDAGDRRRENRKGRASC